MCQQSLYVEARRDSVRASLSHALVPNNQTEAQASVDGHVDNSLRFSLLESLCRPCHCHNCPSSSCTNRKSACLHDPGILQTTGSADQCKLISEIQPIEGTELCHCKLASIQVVVAMSLTPELAKLPGAKVNCQIRKARLAQCRPLRVALFT